MHIYQYKRAFQAIDINHDGYLTRLEVSIRAPQLSAFFDRMTESGSNRITLKDMLASSRVFRFSSSSGERGKSAGESGTSASALIAINENDFANLEFALNQLSYDAKNGDQLDVSSGLSEGQLLNFARKAPGVISIATEEPQQVDKIVVIAGPDDDEAPLGMQNGDGSTEIVVWGSEFIEYSAGSYCRALCWGLGSAVCAAVGTSCVVGTVITVGGLAIPCTLAIIASCAASVGAASLCSDACPP